MLKLEDLDEFNRDYATYLSRKGSVIVVRVESGTVIINDGIEKDSPSVRSTENGLVLSQEGIDGWDRLVFIGDDGCFYKTVELEPPMGFRLLTTKEKYDLLRGLHTTDSFDGEPNFPCWADGKFTLAED
jgi:hypothetical protein